MIQRIAVFRHIAPWVVLGVFFAIVSVGCKSPGKYRLQADTVAARIITQKQKQALGKSESFSIEKTRDTLRRRLLLDQSLPYSAPASLNTRDLSAIKHWPKDTYLDAPTSPSFYGPDLAVLPEEPVRLSLLDALQIGAANSRDYQTRKEAVYTAALDLDLESNDFRTQFTSLLSGTHSTELDAVEGSDGTRDQRTGVGTSGQVGLSKKFQSGASFSSNVGVDLVKLLTQDENSARGLFADSTVTVPLLRGAGKHIVTEPLTQAERNVVYAIYDFERYKRSFAVQIASSYLGVLRLQQDLRNSEDNYRRLIMAQRRARRLADAGRLPEIQVDQSLQDELRARNRWVTAQQDYESRLDNIKLLLGLPPDAFIELEPKELEEISQQAQSVLMRLNELDEDDATTGTLPAQSADDEIILSPPRKEERGPYEIDAEVAVKLALENRLDLRNAQSRVFDSQRRVVVAADLLRAELSLGGSGTIGARRTVASAGQPNSDMKFDEGSYSSKLVLNLPFERTRERNLYRQSLINLEKAVRDLQLQEDTIKLEVRTGLRNLLEYRETLKIQTQAVTVAERRVSSTDLFLQAGRAQIRDVLEAQEALVSAQNALTSALVSYRVSELEFQRDLGVIEVNEKGLWIEYLPPTEIAQP